jgi:hypothetical protein
MPLAFDSLSHGTVAFGFFNIESDMLLLEHYFLFATEFCDYVTRIAEQDGEGSCKMSWEVYNIKDPKDIGDLMGAIQGVRYTGFIGELYQQFPFPVRPQEFKQRPDGVKNRAIVEATIEKYANRIKIPFSVDKDVHKVMIGQIRFTKTTFQELIRYVWQGGYPRWKDETRPDYVTEMKRKIESGRKKLFRGLTLDK